MSVLFYKKPDYIVKEGGPLSKSNCQKYVERAACTRAQIPPELSWENVMEGKTLPPCSISDFLDYLMYISHDAENLQFWLWMRDYTKRFNALPAATKRLSPRWVPETPYSETIGPPVPPKDDMDVDDFDFDTVGNASYHRAAAENERFAKQPFRREISQITAHYILPGAPRELNISHKDRSNLLATLSKTTHPSAFEHILELTTLTLRNHSHPNFIRWSICNGNQPRVLFLRSFAIFWLTVGCVISLVLILSNKSRWIRLAAILPIWFGTVNIVAAARGLCVLLFRRGTREIHPWEISTPGTSTGRTQSNKSTTNKFSFKIVSRKTGGYGQISSPLVPLSNQGNRITTKDKSELAEPKPALFDSDVEALSVYSGYTTLEGKLETFGPSNTYDGEPWAAKWKKMFWVRKLALKKVAVKEAGLRMLQNKIVLQAHLWGIIVTIPFMCAVVACPQVGLY